MAKCILLRSQKNDVLESVKSLGLDPFNFKWSVEGSNYTDDIYGDSESVECLNYEGEGFFYKFDFMKGKHYAIFAPGSDKLVDEKYPGNWENQLIYVGNWLSYLKREVEQPDLWAGLYKYQLPPSDQLITDIGNEPFTVKEAEQLTEGIKRVQAYIETELDLNVDQHFLMSDKLDYLLEAAKRQGRKDWFHTSIGVIFTLASAIALSPEQTRNIWDILKGAISGIILLLR
jgi:hypothetical protein